MSQTDQISILIVDDKEDKLVALEACLSDLGLNIVRAGSGRDALRCLLHQDFAAILLDVNMPGLDGFETASLIRQRRNSQTTPILFITAYGDEPYVSRGYALGAVDYILTPVIPEVLRTKVAVFVELYRKTLEVRRQAEKLQQRANQLAGLAAELTQAEHRERRRLAQVLHDNLQQLLVAARMRLGALVDAGAKSKRAIIAEVDDLLNQSIEASRTLTGELSPPILYDAGLEAAFEWLARQMKRKHGLNVLTDCDGSADFMPENLRSFVFDAVRELLFNCVKHAGVKEARVQVHRVADETVKVIVADHGAGFDPVILESSAVKADHFGLFSIRERATLLNGEVTIVSAPGCGTTITLTLPDRICPYADSPAQIPSAQIVPAAGGNGDSHPAPVAGAKVRVLLVDDHEILRKGLLSMLEGHGDIEVVGEAMDGPTAIDAARSLRPDVIVMDVAMPGMSGVEATRHIKRELPRVRIIGLSLHNREDMAAAMTLAGASTYLSKGGPPEALIAAIHSMGRTTPPLAESSAVPSKSLPAPAIP